MANRKQTRGVCQFCGKEMTKAGLTRHFSKCAKYQEAIAAAGKRAGKSQRIYHLVVQDAWKKDYWLHLEMKNLAKLEALDDYLRAIWLECCGHMSQFSIGGWRGDEISMNLLARQVLEKGLQLTHIYDFGSSSETLVNVVGERDGKPLTKHPIFLMARNELPEETCMECKNRASWFCFECMVEHEESGCLCDDHVKSHPHDDYGDPVRIVNSPRVGMCGYNGPAEPPY